MPMSAVVVHVLADLESKVEAKVKAAATASAVTGFVVTLLGGLAVFHGGPVPSVITAAVGALVTGGLTFVAGYLAKHTPRTPPAVPVISSTSANLTMAPATSNPAAPTT